MSCEGGGRKAVFERRKRPFEKKEVVEMDEEIKKEETTKEAEEEMGFKVTEEELDRALDMVLNGWGW